MADYKPAHRAGCTRPAPITQTTKSGSRMLRCGECGRYWFPDSAPHKTPAAAPEPAQTFADRYAPETATAAPSTEPTKAAPSSRYVCRIHYAPVRPNGRGCGACAAEQARR